MKIIRGDLKGRNILCLPDIRPVSTRVKKSCFDIIIELLPEARVLDLFAGSGSLGLEALSCDAQDVVFIDAQKSCVDAIKKNLLSFNEHRGQVYLKDVFIAIRDLCLGGKKFDVIFIDPPYYKGLFIKTLQTLEEHDILSPSGYIIGFCYAKDAFLKESRDFLLVEQRKYGQTQLIIYKKHE
ncbi:MAG: 16S rRNA (guanine(966)-N(2))-methyltransferase RsmD [Candidatus Omnitrophota bacterium]|nr:16S rRNA (guanine(966)-N(2))-methyltransferase RsmD [Candidatus Omnitrophota bacterium]